MRTAGIVAATALSFASLTALGTALGSALGAGLGQGVAHADTGRAWAAAKAGLPADAKIVVGVDVAAVKKTQLFATYFPKLRDRPEVAEMLGTMKDSCKLDPLSIVQGVVVGMSSDQQEGAVYIGLSGVDRTKLSSCFQRVAQAKHKDAKITVKQSGDITEITKGGDTAFVGWVGKDVIVVSLHAEDKPSLIKWMAGKGGLARSEVSRSLAKLNTSAAVWGALEASKEIEPGATAKGGYGMVTLSSGNVAADLRVVMENAAQATTVVGSANKQLDAARQTGQLPPPIAAVLKAVTITADKDELRARASVTEGDLATVLGMALGGLADKP